MKLSEKINLVCYVIAIVVAMLNIFYGIKYQIREMNFQKNAKVITASVYQISNRKDGNKVLYFSYIINNKTYEGIFVKNSSFKKNPTNIKIYYDKNNPKIYTDGTINKSGIYSIILGSVILLFGIFELFIKKRIQIEKK